MRPRVHVLARAQVGVRCVVPATLSLLRIVKFQRMTCCCVMLRVMWDVPVYSATQVTTSIQGGVAAIGSSVMSSMITPAVQ